MTLDELKRLSSDERENLFHSTPEPAYGQAINTGTTDDIVKILDGYRDTEIIQNDREKLQKDLIIKACE